MFKKYHLSTISGPVFAILFFTSYRAFAAPVFSDQQARAKLEEILGRPEFAAGNLLVVWMEKLIQGLTRFFDRVSGKQAVEGGLGYWEYLLIFLSVVGILFIVIYVSLRLYRAFSPDYASGEQGVTQTPVTSEAQLREKAAACAEKGEFREAVRYLYLSLLLFLDQRRFIRFRLSKTNREYLHEYAENSAENEGFPSLVAFFERKWYGMEPCDDKDYREFHTMYLSLVKER